MKKEQNKIRKIIQYTYLIIFVLSSIGIVGNIELDEPVTKFQILMYVTSGLLVFSKIIYCKIHYPNKIYYWDFD